MLDPHPNAKHVADNRYVDLQVWLTTPQDPTEKTAMLWSIGQ